MAKASVFWEYERDFTLFCELVQTALTFCLCEQLPQPCLQHPGVGEEYASLSGTGTGQSDDFSAHALQFG